MSNTNVTPDMSTDEVADEVVLDLEVGDFDQAEADLEEAERDGNRPEVLSDAGERISEALEDADPFDTL